MVQLVLMLATAILLASAAGARAETPDSDATILAVGVLLHDQGPWSDRFERGTDLNLELEFAEPGGRFWKRLGSPRPHAGMTLNFVGDTSAAYLGLTYPFRVSERLFAAFGFGLAVHDGPLHKDPVGCRERSDCGFGSRILPRVAVEGGIRLTDRQSLSLFFDHMSHAELLADENEGIDHLGLRFRRSF
jgi:hypothetical protein